MLVPGSGNEIIKVIWMDIFTFECDSNIFFIGKKGLFYNKRVFYAQSRTEVSDKIHNSHSKVCVAVIMKKKRIARVLH